MADSRHQANQRDQLRREGAIERKCAAAADSFTSFPLGPALLAFWVYAQFANENPRTLGNKAFSTKSCFLWGVRIALWRHFRSWPVGFGLERETLRDIGRPSHCCGVAKEFHGYFCSFRRTCTAFVPNS